MGSYASIVASDPPMPAHSRAAECSGSRGMPAIVGTIVPEPDPAVTALAAATERARASAVRDNQHHPGDSCSAQLPEIVITDRTGAVIVSSRSRPAEFADRYRIAMGMFVRGNFELLVTTSTNTRVRVKSLTGGITELNVHNDWTICALNNIYAMVTDCSIDRHWYTFDNGDVTKTLTSEETLCEAGIRDGAVITAMHAM